MKAVLPEIPPDILDWRRRTTGADRWDEMWEGVLHMPPMPTIRHQNFQGALEHWLRSNWARTGGSVVYGPVNITPVGGWPRNYRIPDLVLLTASARSLDRNEYLEGPPTVVVEIRSPGDETYEKMPFYAELGVPEMWIIERDSKEAELYVLRSGEYETLPAGPDGWLRSSATGIEFRTEPGGKFAIQLADQPKTRAILPEK